MTGAGGRRRPSWKGLCTLAGLGVLVAACQATPSPSSSPGESVPAFVSTSYPLGGPADCAYGGEIAQIKAVDQLTVEFSLCYRDPAFLSKVALANNAIQDGAWLTKYGPTGQLAAQANGTGPYRVTKSSLSTAPVDLISLGRFAGYWGKPAKAAVVTIGSNADPAARMQALHRGSVDGIDDPSASDLATIAANSTLQLVPRELLNTTYIGMTNDFAPFDNVKVRQALARGLDRQRMILNAFPSGSSLARFFTPCSIEFGCVGQPWYERDLEAARSLLVNPGFPGPLATHIYYRDEAGCGLADPALVAHELQAQLQDDLKITADLRPLPSLTFNEKLSAGLLDGLYVLDWCAEYPDVTNFLDRQFDNPATRQFGTIDPSIADALAAAGKAADANARKAAYTAANDAIREVVPLIPIAHGGSATAWKADVVGAVASPLDAESFAAMDPGGRGSLAWMQTRSPASLYCTDPADGDSVRLCQNVFEQLYTFKPGTAVVTPGLATSCDPNEQLTVWTCHLREGVTFHDGAALDSNDVLLSYAAQWDAKHVIHVGSGGRFDGWSREFGPFLNGTPPAP
ncbi:MAG: ABC transporter substrate-binding protein [Chloroflexota bacterium]|nr:ABC transporter substrate-binding protein [Chloroflexota bacterium]